MKPPPPHMRALNEFVTSILWPATIFILNDSNSYWTDRIAGCVEMQRNAWRKYNDYKSNRCLLGCRQLKRERMRRWNGSHWTMNNMANDAFNFHQINTELDVESSESSNKDSNRRLYVRSVCWATMVAAIASPQLECLLFARAFYCCEPISIREIDRKEENFAAPKSQQRLFSSSWDAIIGWRNFTSAHTHTHNANDTLIAPAIHSGDVIIESITNKYDVVGLEFKTILAAETWIRKNTHKIGWPISSGSNNNNAQSHGKKCTDNSWHKGTRCPMNSKKFVCTRHHTHRDLAKE